MEENYAVGFRTVLAIIALALANCCPTVTNTTNTIISFQVREVGGSAKASWIANGSFLLTLACGPLAGTLADRFGKKWFIVVGCAIGIVGSFVSSAANDVYQIIGGNILTGIANACCIVAVAANQEIIPNKFRPYAFGFAQTINSALAILGVFLAGYYAEELTWRWSYRFNGIVFAVAGLSVLLTYKPPPTTIRRNETLGNIIRSLDVIGMILLAGSLALITIALTWGGSTYAWNSSTILGTLIGGCAGLVVFGFYEWLVKKENALLDHRLFGNANFPILCFVCMIDGMLLLAINVLYANEITDLFSQDAIQIAVDLSPFLITSTVGCIPAGYIMARTKGYRALLIGALLWCALFTGLMALLTPEKINFAYAFSALFGLGTAVTTVVPIVALTLSVPSYLLGTAGSLSVSSRALGGIVGVTIFTAIYNNKFAVYLPEQVSAALASADSQIPVSAVVGALSAPGNPVEALKMIPNFTPSLIDPILAAEGTANSECFKYVWIAVACVILGGAIASGFLKPVNEHMNHHVESALEQSTTRDSQMTKLNTNDLHAARKILDSKV